MTLTFFAMFGVFFLIAQYFQLVLDYSPLESGLLQLPVAAIIMGVSPQVPGFVERYGPARVVPVGLTSVALGLALFSTIGVNSSLAAIYMAMTPLALGIAIAMTPLTTLIMASVPLSHAGVGSAMNDTTRELGGALGVAVLGSVVTSQYATQVGDVIAQLPATASAAVESGVSGALGVAAEIGGPQGEALADVSRQAFVDGLGAAAVVGAIVVFGAALVARFLLPHDAAAFRAARLERRNARPAGETEAVAPVPVLAEAPVPATAMNSAGSTVDGIDGGFGDAGLSDLREATSVD